MEDLMVGSGIPLAYYLTVIGFVVMAISFIIGAAMSIKKSWPFIAGLAVLAILFFVLYSGADGTMPDYMPASQITKQEITSGVMKFVGGGTFVAVILTIGAFIFMVLDMVVSIFR